MLWDGTPEFVRESWALYSLGLLIISLRLIANVRRFGFRYLKVDDWVMVQCIAWYTILCVSLNQILLGGGSNLMTPDEEAALTPETIKERVIGSKWSLVSEEGMMMTLWSAKVCMLSVYFRITQGTPTSKYVKLCAAYVGAAFIGCQLSLLLECRPFSQYWAVPTMDQVNCAIYLAYSITVAALHISCELMLLTLGIPIFIQAQLPHRQKIILLGVFGMGVFVIIAAILNKVYALVPSLQGYQYTLWYFREASVAVYVANLPFLWSLLRDSCPVIGAWTKDRSNRQTSIRANGRATGAMAHHGLSSQDDKNFPRSEIRYLATVRTMTTPSNANKAASPHRKAYFESEEEEDLEMQHLAYSGANQENDRPIASLHFPSTTPVTRHDFVMSG